MSSKVHKTWASILNDEEFWKKFAWKSWRIAARIEAEPIPSRKLEKLNPLVELPIKKYCMGRLWQEGQQTPLIKERFNRLPKQFVVFSCKEKSTYDDTQEGQLKRSVR